MRWRGHSIVKTTRMVVHTVREYDHKLSFSRLPYHMHETVDLETKFIHFDEQKLFASLSVTSEVYIHTTCKLQELNCNCCLHPHGNQVTQYNQCQERTNQL